MTIPAHNLILITADKVYIRVGHKMDRFTAALEQLEGCLQAGKVWNQEFIDLKSNISRACEHAQHIAADACDRRTHHGDARDEIGYAFAMNQAAKLSRNLKKLAADKITPAIQNYINTLDQITGLWNYLGEFKPLIVKGRKPSENPKPVDETNMGTCTCCGNLQKLDQRQKMVHHGYQISAGHGRYFGYRAGSCFGVGYLPYEFSYEGNKAWVEHLMRLLKSTRLTLKNYEAQPDTLLVMVAKGQTKTLDKGTAAYLRELDRRINETKSTIKQIESEIKRQNNLIKEWKLAPLRDGTVKA
jgi:hypothetical protein